MLQPIRRWDRETALLAWLTACVSILSFLFYFRRGEILLYGDAVAHINIARRVFDSRTPGLLQLGTVWLPLPHLLMIPFLLSNWMWKTGVGGSIPSMAAYVFGTIGIFRLVRDGLGVDCSTRPDDQMCSLAGSNHLCRQSEPDLSASDGHDRSALPGAVHLGDGLLQRICAESARSEESNQPAASSPLLKCGLCLAGACLTRYDAWFLAAAMCVLALAVALRTKKREYRRGVAKFILIAAAAPVLWLAYNAIVYRNPLEFANGPYSAKAIEQRTPGASHPGTHDLQTAFSYFLKSAELNLAAQNWQKLWLLLAVAGVIASLSWKQPRANLWPLLLLWIPLPFYTLSVAYSGVPIFMPVWWPFSYYNVRYGLELLPAFAVFVTLAFYLTAQSLQHRGYKVGAAAAVLVFVATSYASIWSAPVTFSEAAINSRSRISLERELADFVRVLPPDSTLLMYVGSHVGALQQAGIPLRRVINEGNHRTWKQPVDLDGLWERALVNPAKYADFVIAFEGDAVSAAVLKDVQQQDLVPLAVIRASGEPKATIYRARTLAR